MHCWLIVHMRMGPSPHLTELSWRHARAPPCCMLLLAVQMPLVNARLIKAFGGLYQHACKNAPNLMIKTAHACYATTVAAAGGATQTAAVVDEDAIDDILQRLFELRVEVQNSLSDVNIEMASIRRKVTLILKLLAVLSVCSKLSTSTRITSALHQPGLPQGSRACSVGLSKHLCCTARTMKCLFWHQCSASLEIEHRHLTLGQAIEWVHHLVQTLAV